MRFYLATFTVWTALVCSVFSLPAEAQSSVSTVQLPGQSTEKIVKLPPGSTKVQEEIGCDRDALKQARKRFKTSFKCFASVSHGEDLYMVADNWLRSEQRPGPYQVLYRSQNDWRILADMSAVTGGFMIATQNNGIIEYLSVSLAEPYDANTGWPYLRYALRGDQVQMIPTGMFDERNNPVAISRASFLESEARARAAKNDIMLQACATVGELTRGLDQVVNEMQIYNYSNDIWQQSRGCNFRNGREIKPGSPKFVGWYLTEPKHGNKRFWSLIFAVEFQPRKEARQILPGVTISEETSLFVSYRIYRESGLNLPATCMQNSLAKQERYKMVRLYGIRPSGILPECNFVP